MWTLPLITLAELLAENLLRPWARVLMSSKWVHLLIHGGGAINP